MNTAYINKLQIIENILKNIKFSFIMFGITEHVQISSYIFNIVLLSRRSRLCVYRSTRYSHLCNVHVHDHCVANSFEALRGVSMFDISVRLFITLLYCACVFICYLNCTYCNISDTIDLCYELGFRFAFFFFI